LPPLDDPAVRAFFEFDTKDAAGRSAFQSKLDECSAYEDIFDSALQRYGAPRWLTAVVFQESGCDRRARSPAGRAGLWQLTPESARAYGLRVSDGQLDQRLNVIRSTSAAIHLLADLERAFGAWDLALAAYQIGPLALLNRISQAGEHPAFKELVRAGLLREETSAYVAAIDAYALALENKRALGFADQGKKRERTAEILVPAGTRFSLIARAASTSTDRIRVLNPEFLGDVLPDGETRVQVPADDAHRAQAFIDSRDPGDRSDTCVPGEFDWGRQSFVASPYAKACPADD
jgi:membrane-bound lytic murein transglycosylase D